MSLVNYKEDYEYAATRLRGTMVVSKGRALIINGMDPFGLCEVSDVMTGENFQTHLKEIDLSPVKLGYVNRKRHAIYTMRAPARYYKQGLTGNVLKTKSKPIQWLSQQMAKTILGVFPTPIMAAEAVHNNESISMAFSRTFAFTSPKEDSLTLEYKGKSVGISTWNEDAKSINYHLNDEYEFLRESLEEALNV